MTLLLLMFAASASAGNAVRSSDKTLDKVDAELSDSAGKPIQLSAFRGKPTVLFYEDRDSKDQNRQLKDELWKRGKKAGLTESANVVGIANLKAYDFWPARGFARSVVEDVEKKVGIKVLIDWKGALTTTPWNLPTKSSTVVLLDADGAVRFSYSGPMSQKEMNELFDKLAQLLPPTPSSASGGGR